MKGIRTVSIGFFLSVFVLTAASAGPGIATAANQASDGQVQNNQSAPDNKAKLSKHNQAKIKQAEAAKAKQEKSKAKLSKRNQAKINQAEASKKRGDTIQKLNSGTAP